MDPRQKKKIWVQRKTPNLEKKQNKQTLDYNAGQKKKKKKMMRFLGSTLAKSCGKGRLQCRDFSSVGEKVVTKRGSKVVGYAYKGAFCGIGYVIGGLTTNSVSAQVQGVEERLLEVSKSCDETEAALEARMKNWKTKNI
ncbi:uncharacterized protein LOC130511907 isoform X2 [Raphanus sativus]|uniref:Uncharacterized protein LOC130504700 isoform X2 n=1 Tax=Raphanus sativus TaxID=3726 RepID=A0A9W3DPM5_RAPSA|nr:uncharacterized protein LOC130504700 isoform X2 [Raphanus sativus]XP_056865744.1 uncharacterized protein LOC130511907 isoform X2 [Raphanus sativus]